MRQIKFRLWDKLYGKMVYEYFKLDYDSRIGTYKYYKSYLSFECGENLGCEVMQYIGLQDKNGKDIYEGDIIKYIICCELGYYHLVIGYDNNTASFGGNTIREIFKCEQKNIDEIPELKNDYDYSLNFIEDGWRMEIIGNIYKNPNLLK